MTKCDVIRLGVNFAYMARSLPEKDETEYVNCGRAVLKHHFDNHDYCGCWCRRKLMTLTERRATAGTTQQEEKQQDEEEPLPKFYRCKTKDKELYDYLYGVTARFVTFEALKEVAHGGDTQVNESLNNTISWVAPKNKTYSASKSLLNRICIAVGIHCLGTFEYFDRLLNRLGIDMPEDTKYSLEQKSNTRNLKIARTKLNEYKKRRMAKHFENLAAHAKVARYERSTREGVSYQSGMGMGGGYTEEELTAATATTSDDDGDKKPAAKKPKLGRAGRPMLCNACKGTDHCRISSRKCKNHEEYLKAKGKRTKLSASTAKDLAERDAEQLAHMDCLPFTNDIEDDEESVTAYEYNPDGPCII